jgi:hypothetical protein
VSSIAAAVAEAKEGHYQQLTAAGIKALPGKHYCVVDFTVWFWLLAVMSQYMLALPAWANAFSAVNLAAVMAFSKKLLQQFQVSVRQS